MREAAFFVNTGVFAQIMGQCDQSDVNFVFLFTAI